MGYVRALFNVKRKVILAKVRAVWLATEQQIRYLRSSRMLR